jgi:hypothetical protein
MSFILLHGRATDTRQGFPCRFSKILPLNMNDWVGEDGGERAEEDGGKG